MNDYSKSLTSVADTGPVRRLYDGIDNQFGVPSWTLIVASSVSAQYSDSMSVDHDIDARTDNIGEGRRRPLLEK